VWGLAAASGTRRFAPSPLTGLRPGASSQTDTDQNNNRPNRAVIILVRVWGLDAASGTRRFAPSPLTGLRPGTSSQTDTDQNNNRPNRAVIILVGM